MPHDYDYHFSRTNTRQTKRKKNKKWIFLLCGVAVSLVVVFFVILVFNQPAKDTPVASDESTETGANEKTETTSSKPEVPTKEETNQDTSEDSEAIADTADETDGANSQGELELTEVESNEEIVKDAYTADWEPIGTSQEGSHQISWEQGSTDWQEMLQAAKIATGVAPDEMNYLWVSGNGEQKVIATFSDRSITNHYRVYLSWVENEGWQPTRVDRLTENDQKHRFEAAKDDQQTNDSSANEDSPNVE
ncbi:YrrS family protein [Paraliobacillus ryukyuensis]|uniref:YrrS family protein n=1 Tax=Paraliobacillus ryukyuensis TaxID=200904 RepID=UPI0009A8754E|nr:YrrS family protein [Paraliobacillus ryukyuensis]